MISFNFIIFFIFIFNIFGIISFIIHSISKETYQAPLTRRERRERRERRRKQRMLAKKCKKDGNIWDKKNKKCINTTGIGVTNTTGIGVTNTTGVGVTNTTGVDNIIYNSKGEIQYKGNIIDGVPNGKGILYSNGQKIYEGGMESGIPTEIGDSSVSNLKSICKILNVECPSNDKTEIVNTIRVLRK